MAASSRGFGPASSARRARLRNAVTRRLSSTRSTREWTFGFYVLPSMPTPPLSDRVNSQLDRIQAMLRQGAKAQKEDQDAVKDWSAEEDRRRQRMEAQWQDLSDRLDALYAKVNADAAEGTKLGTRQFIEWVESWFDAGVLQ